jgi:hypothetical protein
LPAPLVPAGTNLRDFPKMMVDVKRLRDSNFGAAVTGEEFRCGVFLWCAAWHQEPAGSLPDDDIQLAKLSGVGRNQREWKKVRAGALYGFVKCSDGRLYHPVIAEMVLEAQRSRFEHWYVTECRRIKKAAQRSKIEPVYPTLDAWTAHYIATGSRKWESDAPACPLPVPETGEGRPGDIGTNVIEGKVREGKALSTTHSAQQAKYLERAESISGALRGYGYQVKGDSLEVTQLATLEATDGEIAEACGQAKGVFRTKPLSWVVSRIEGRRADAAARGQPQAPPPPADPVDQARRVAAERLDNALIEARQLAEFGHITPEERARREADARAAHALAKAGLEAAA